MMLIAAVIMTVGIGFNWLVKEHIRASEGLKNKADAILKARSAYDTVIYLILNGSVLPREIVVSGGEDIAQINTLPLNGQEVSLSDDVRVRIQESNGLLSLNAINRYAFEKLIKRVSSQDTAAIAIDSLLDWVDVNSLSRVNGAKEFYYRSSGLPYGPRTYAIQYIEEIGFIRGFGEELYGKLQPYVTMLPSTGFNPNTASDEVLKAYLDIDEDYLKTLKDYIAKKPVQSDGELFALTGKRIAVDEDSIYFTPSSFMDVTVSVGQPKSIYTIKAGLRIIQGKDSPYSILYWREA
jgi:general secretion pathway protein K